MCGILGFHVGTLGNVPSGVLERLLERLFQLSESRGREAAGLALADGRRCVVIREAMPAGKMVKLPSYQKTVGGLIAAAPREGSLTAMGHARLVTNGWQDRALNNQPVIRDSVVLLHNGIVVNDKSLWRQLEDMPDTDLDSEVLAAYLAKAMSSGKSAAEGARDLFAHMNGNASIAFMHLRENALYLATNNSSIYYMHTEDVFVFGSEYSILDRVRKDKHINGALPSFTEPERLPNKILGTIYSAGGKAVFSLAGEGLPSAPVVHIPRLRRVEDDSRRFEEARDTMRRCTRCILPETMPFIRFDEEGVCNYCRQYAPMSVAGKEKALEELAPCKKTDGKPDSLVMLSGGRDSCYGLHYVVTELGLNPIAYTYDWGMVTDIARRNTARMCGALGVEHIIVSADIAWKRRNVRKNLLAWLKKPELGMVPLLMAGDKQYFYYAEQIRQANKLPVTLVSENPLEATRFKAGFCGVNEAQNRIFNISGKDKVKLFGYYAKQYIRNPRYLNSTIFDNFFAFFSSYIMPHRLFHLYKYESWNEEKVNRVLLDGYDWETDPEAKSTWRIGDGTAAFYNYIYYTMAGFTENDTLRSNQIREGMIGREEALAAAREENLPRWSSMDWYAKTIGFNLVEAILAINGADKLYDRRDP